MAAWFLLGVVWVVGPLLLTWRYVRGATAQVAVGVVVVVFTAGMWTAIEANDSSTAAVGFVTMAPLAYAAPAAAIAARRLRRRS